MSEERQSPDEKRRVAELLRANRELAGEIRELTLGRRAKPRSAQLPAARHVAKLRAEREALAAERDELAAERELRAVELEQSRAEAERQRGHGERLEKQVQEQAHRIDEQGRRLAELNDEVERLRGGLKGILRSARARLSPRR